MLDYALRWWAEYRLPGTALLLALVVAWFFRRNEPGLPSDENLDLVDEQVRSTTPADELLNQVKSLESLRINSGYKPGWLYYKCKEKGLLSEMYYLRSRGVIENPFKTPPPTFIGDLKLSIELVPSSCWYSNLRSVLEADTWKSIKRLAYKNAAYCCEVCGGKGPEWPVEAHEVWGYDDANLVQKLLRIVALCPACHEVKHFGLANTRGRTRFAMEQLIKVNGWDEKSASDYVDREFEVWEWRSDREWRVDLSLLSSYGISPEKIKELEANAGRERDSAAG